MMRRLITLLAALLSLAVVPAAHAYSSPEVGMADDGVLLNGTDSQISSTVSTWQGIGISSVRVFVRWGDIAPARTAKKMPAGFDPSNSSDPGYNWGKIDRAVGATAGAGLKVYLTITGSGPLWAMSSPSNGSNGRRNPSPTKYAQFAEAVAERYGSQVSDYILYNEPNQTLWLQDQSTCRKGKCVPHAPHVYRKLVRAAYPKIKAADSGSTVLIGALSPSGTTPTARSHNLRPLTFLRAFGCVDKKYKPIRSGECKSFKPAMGDGFAYHPHGVGLAPNKHAKNRDAAQMGDLSRLTNVLDKLTRKKRLKVNGASKFPLYFDEYGYQTNPPDRFGVSLSLQAKYLRQGAYVAWRNSRVRLLTQYSYIDDAFAKGGAGWQAGLLTRAGDAKPSFAVFPNPFWAQKIKAGTVQLWGQVRPGSGVRSVQLQRRSGNSWVTIQTVNTDARGYYYANVSNPATTTYRAVTPAGTTATGTIFGR